MIFIETTENFFSKEKEDQKFLSLDAKLVEYNSAYTNFNEDSCIIKDNFRLSVISEALKQSKSNHYISKESDFYYDDVCLATKLIEKSSFHSEDGGTRLHLETEFLELDNLSISSKSTSRADLENFLKEKINQSCLEAALICFEELYMNSVFDAPIEAAKNGWTSHFDQISLPKIKLSLSDSKLIMTCWDYWGSLDVPKALNKMQSVEERGMSDSMNRGQTGGAGLGCYIMWKQSQSMIIQVFERDRTVISCIIPTQLSYKKRDHMQRSLHILK